MTRAITSIHRLDKELYEKYVTYMHIDDNATLVTIAVASYCDLLLH